MTDRLQQKAEQIVREYYGPVISSDMTSGYLREAFHSTYGCALAGLTAGIAMGLERAALDGAGVSEKMDYREEERERWKREVHAFVDECAGPNCPFEFPEVEEGILALLDKVRQEQAAECAKHKPSFNLESCMADGCDWKFGNGKITWSEHISALGRKWGVSMS